MPLGVSQADQRVKDQKGIEYHLAADSVFVGYDNYRDSNASSPSRFEKTYWIAHGGLPVDARTFDNGWEAAVWRDHWRKTYPSAIVRWEADVE